MEETEVVTPHETLPVKSLSSPFKMFNNAVMGRPVSEMEEDQEDDN